MGRWGWKRSEGLERGYLEAKKVESCSLKQRAVLPAQRGQLGMQGVWGTEGGWRRSRVWRGPEMPLAFP